MFFRWYLVRFTKFALLTKISFNLLDETYCTWAVSLLVLYLISGEELLSTFERIIEALERITVKTVKCYTVIIDHVELIDYITQLTPIQTGSTVLAVL